MRIAVSADHPKYGIGHSLIAMPGLAIAHTLSAWGLHAEAALYTMLFAVNGALLLCLITVDRDMRYPKPWC
jgi:hypothetical protein